MPLNASDTERKVSPPLRKRPGYATFIMKKGDFRHEEIDYAAARRRAGLLGLFRRERRGNQGQGHVGLQFGKVMGIYAADIIK